MNTANPITPQQEKLSILDPRRILRHYFSWRGAGRAPQHLLREPGARRALSRLKTISLAYLLGSLVVFAAGFVVPFGPEDGSQLGVVIRAASVSLIALIIVLLVFASARGSRGAYRVLRVFVVLESSAIIIASIVVPGDPTILYAGKLFVGALAVGTAISTFDPRLRRALVRAESEAPVGS